MSTSSPQPVVIDPSQAWDGNDGPWSSFTLGFGTPTQNVRMLVSTTGYQPWVVLPQGCAAPDPSTCAASRGELFLTNASTTWHNEGLFALEAEQHLGYTDDNGQFGLDTITLGLLGSGAPTETNQTVIGIANPNIYMGLLGVNPKSTNLTNFNDPQQSLMSTLKEKNVIPSLSYGYTAGAQYRLKQVLGSLTLGGYDAARFTPSNLSFGFAADDSRDLVVGIQSITTQSSGNPSNTTSLLPNPILSFIDAAVAQIWLPLEACQAFETAFGLQYDNSSELYLVNSTLHTTLLAQNASITFKIGTDTTTGQTINITFPYAAFDLQVSYPLVENTTNYFPLKRAANETQYTLGRTFLQESYLIVDYEQSNFSVNPCVFSENQQQNITAIRPTLTKVPQNGTTSTPASSSKSTSSSNASVSIGAIVGIVIAALIVLAVLSLGSWLVLKRRRRLRRDAEIAEVPDNQTVPSDQKAELPSESLPSELRDTDNSKAELGTGETMKSELDGKDRPPVSRHELSDPGSPWPELDSRERPAEMYSPPAVMHEMPGD